MRLTFFMSSYVLLCWGCHKTEHLNQQQTTFVTPVVIQSHTPDSIQYFKEVAIRPHNPLCAGKYSFTDSLILKKFRSVRDSLYTNDFLENKQPDTMQTHGFTLIPDYTTTISGHRYIPANAYYPIYVVNQTLRDKSLYGKDGYVFAMQEALDTHGKWRPISSYARDFCEDGYFTLRVHPSEFCIFLLPKYKGTYHTKLRVRFANYGEIYISNPFAGVIDKKQFYIDQDSWLYRECLKNPENAVAEYFFGSEPLEMDEIKAKSRQKQKLSSK